MKSHLTSMFRKATKSLCSRFSTRKQVKQIKSKCTEKSQTKLNNKRPLFQKHRSKIQLQSIFGMIVNQWPSNVSSIVPTGDQNQMLVYRQVRSDQKKQASTKYPHSQGNNKSSLAGSVLQPYSQSQQQQKFVLRHCCSSISAFL